MLFEVLKLKWLTDYHYYLPKPLGILRTSGQKISSLFSLTVLPAFSGYQFYEIAELWFSLWPMIVIFFFFWFHFLLMLSFLWNPFPIFSLSIQIFLDQFCKLLIFLTLKYCLSSQLKLQCSVFHIVIKCLITFFLLFSWLLFVLYYYLIFHILCLVFLTRL